ncbi:hypothetical protein [Lederbergia lenta]|uniref:ABC transporter periplasmic binding protein n=1 Tax=Lederbergia lenta TaxID=1467 RepID=A0A2X4YXJ8_LEDLE|nr:hypothetical protein [Lederbergia lenta]MCM3111639.1 hypothetical protein [Lederbergia lenta]MEC2324969.1 hypothetical protein [Lederbergia lenta]SQI56535.1 ABC transporter periplasmic binding protein [Lederbergia lenta]
MKAIFKLSMFIMVSILLTGCLYPQEKKKENQIPYEDQIQSVQLAVDTFQESSGGLLPIKNKDMDTPMYLKYPIDFLKLTPQYLSSSPGNAYESGGIYQYVLIDVETKPTVKVIDLRIAEKIREIKTRMKVQGYPPYKETIAKNIYSIDYSKIGYKTEPYVVSPYTNNNLPLVITSTGEIYVDYSSDLFISLQENDHNFSPGDDIRQILSNHSPIVPAYSLPYTIDENNEPVYME